MNPEIIEFDRPTVYTSFDQLPLMLSIPQTAAVLGISRSAAYTMATEGALPILQIGARKVVPKEALIAWIRTNTYTRASEERRVKSEE